MSSRSITVLSISPSEVGGGAELVARELVNACRRRGLRMQMAVGRKQSGDPEIIELPHDQYRSSWARIWLGIATTAKRPKIRNLGEPLRWWSRFRGREDMNFPATAHLFDLVGAPIDLIHAHNLHGADGGYFDLRAIPALSRHVPLMMTLHDGWLLAGHCAHSFGCTRWETGCGRCPDLSIPEMIRQDGSAANFALKKRVFEGCSLHLAAPSRWLMDRAERSLLAPSIKSARVIPNGIDLDCFTPGDRAAARRRLGLDQRANIVLCIGNTLRENIWRDFHTAIAAVRMAAAERREKTILLGLGDTGDRISEGFFEMEFLAHLDDPAKVASHLRAADIFLHSSWADTFPTVVLESMACGVPVVASAVGGIPEQVVDGRTGFLVGPGNPTEMAHRIIELIDDRELAQRFGAAGAERAARFFGRRLMVDRYVDWYRELIDGAENSR